MTERMNATLRALHAAGIDAVGGRQATRRALEGIDCGPRVRVAAIGKAASAMALGARETLGETLLSGLVVTKYDHLDAVLAADPRFTCLESAHPVPDAASLAAGEALIDFVSGVADDEHLLALVSGGASALVERLDDGLTLDDLRRRTDALLAGGAPIGEINRVRRALSRIKGGRLAAHLGACRVTQLLISDVPGDRPEDIGSGPLVMPPSADPRPDVAARPDTSRGASDAASGAVTEAAPGPTPPDTPAMRIDTRIIASSSIAQRAVATAAVERGLTVAQPEGSLDGDVEETCERVASRLLAPDAAPGIYVWGGEPTVRLPPEPGRGGRNQHLALALATRIAGRGDLAVLVAATDGSDGPTTDAGGLVDGTTLARGEALGLDVRAALQGADAGPWLERTGALVTTGPTGTNVMDLAIAIRST